MTPGTIRDVKLASYAALGTLECPLCECDADDSGTITFADVVSVLSAAMGERDPLSGCPPCGYLPEVRGPGEAVSIAVTNIECF